MIFTTRTNGPDGLAARLAARFPQARQDALLDRAARRLADAARIRLGHAPQVNAVPGRRFVGSAEAADVARETGGLATPADPWLLPALADLKSGDAP